MSNYKAWYVTGNTDCYEVFLGSTRIAICDLKEDADLVLDALDALNTINTLDPNGDTDCDIWSEDVVQLLMKPFKYENAADKEMNITGEQIEQVRNELRSLLIEFYQTHL
jgi:hypothetical protein